MIRLCNLNSTTPPEMPYTLFCLIPSSKSYFSIDIDENKTVGHLKKEIKKEKSVELKALDADALRLYKINVDISDKNKRQKIIEEIYQGDYEFTSKEFLHPIDELEVVFESSAPPRQTIHILVLLPEGESMDPRMCRRG